MLALRQCVNPSIFQLIFQRVIPTSLVCILFFITNIGFLLAIISFEHAMFFRRCQALMILTVCLLDRTIVYSILRCGQYLCRDGQICCPHGNATAGPCCKPFVDKTYYNITMVTRKLSGVLIMLLLFAVGYFIQRMLCSRSGQRTPPPNGQPTATMSQEFLVERCTPDSLAYNAPTPELPTYEECKRLPTYEETVRDDSRELNTEVRVCV